MVVEKLARVDETREDVFILHRAWRLGDEGARGLQFLGRRESTRMTIASIMALGVFGVSRIKGACWTAQNSSTACLTPGHDVNP
jgi:hypothetical protein